MQSEIALKVEHTKHCTSEMFKGRVMQSMVTYQNALYIFGGRQSGSDIGICREGHFLNDLLRYDLKTESWSAEVTNGTPPSPRFGHSAVVNKSSMLVFGGQGYYLLNNDLFQYKFSTQLWTRVEVTGNKYPFPRWSHIATVYEDRMWIFGGQSEPMDQFYRRVAHNKALRSRRSCDDEKPNRRSDLWSIRLSAGKTHWKKIKNKVGFSVRQYSNAPVAIVDDQMYFLVKASSKFLSAYKLLIFNLKEQTWTRSRKTPVSGSMNSITAMVVVDQKLIVFNGVVDVLKPSHHLTLADKVIYHVHCYNLNSGVWSSLAPITSSDINSEAKLIVLSGSEIPVYGHGTYIFVFDETNSDSTKTSNLYKIDCKRIYPKCNLYEDYGHMLSSRLFADVEFVIGGKQVNFSAHTAITAARSEYLRTLIREAKEKGVQDMILQVKIPTAIPEAFEIMLKYVYTDEIDPPNGIDGLFLYLDLFKQAVQMSMKSLEQLIIDQLTNEFLGELITSSNVLQILSKAHNVNCWAIREYCLNFIVEDYIYMDLIESKEFIGLDKHLCDEISIKRETKDTFSTDQTTSYNIFGKPARSSSCSTFAQDMEVFLNSVGKEFSDVTLLGSGFSIPAHKCILAMRCSYFKAMFRSFDPPDNIVHIQIGNIMPTEEAVNVLLNYIYYGNAKIPIEHSLLLFAASDFYGFSTNRLQEMVKGNLELNGTCEQMIKIAEEAHVTQQVDMKQYLLPLIVKHCPEVSSMAKTQNMSDELLVEIRRLQGREFRYTP